MAEKPKVDATAQKELDKIDNHFNEAVKSLAEKVANPPKLVEEEQQTKLSSREVNSFDAPYIKPTRQIASKEQFNEKYRAQYDFDKEYIRAIAENLELVGTTCEFWTKPYPGLPAQFWQVPVNKPVMIPRYVAKRLAECSYIRYMADDNRNQATGTEGGHQFYTNMIARETRRRLDCRPAGNTMISMFG